MSRVAASTKTAYYGYNTANKHPGAGVTSLIRLLLRTQIAGSRAPKENLAVISLALGATYNTFSYTMPLPTIDENTRGHIPMVLSTASSHGGGDNRSADMPSSGQESSPSGRASSSSGNQSSGGASSLSSSGAPERQPPPPNGGPVRRSARLAGRKAATPDSQSSEPEQRPNAPSPPPPPPPSPPSLDSIKPMGNNPPSHSPVFLLITLCLLCAIGAIIFLKARRRQAYKHRENGAEQSVTYAPARVNATDTSYKYTLPLFDTIPHILPYNDIALLPAAWSEDEEIMPVVNPATVITLATDIFPIHSQLHQYELIAEMKDPVKAGRRYAQLRADGTWDDGAPTACAAIDEDDMGRVGTEILWGASCVIAAAVIGHAMQDVEKHEPMDSHELESAPPPVSIGKINEAVDCSALQRSDFIFVPFPGYRRHRARRPNGRRKRARVPTESTG